MLQSRVRHNFPYKLMPSSVEHVGTKTFSDIMAQLTLFNEGVPGHFLQLMDVPTMRLPNVKMLLC